MTPLRQRMINDMTVRGLANSTMASYLRSVTRLARHYRRSPDQISAPEVQDYLLFLHQQHGLNWSTCNTIRHGVRFFYRITLGLPDPHFYVPGAKVPSTLPQILNHDELVRLFTVTTNLRHRAVLMTAYAAGLRTSELGRLQVDYPFGLSEIRHCAIDVERAIRVEREPITLPHRNGHGLADLHPLWFLHLS